MSDEKCPDRDEGDRPNGRTASLPDTFDELLDLIGELVEQEQAINVQIEDSLTRPETARTKEWRKSAQTARRHIVVRRKRATAKLSALYGASTWVQGRKLEEDFRAALRRETKKARRLDARSEASLTAAKDYVASHAPEHLQGLYDAISAAGQRYDREMTSVAAPSATLGEALDALPEGEEVAG